MGVRCPNRVSPAVMLVVIAWAVAACASTPPRTTAERRADADTAGRVQAALLSDPDICARHIDGAVDRGVVHLGGYVWESDDFQTARRDAASVPGVKTAVAQRELMRGGLAGTST
ncbi:MAG: BON domain-containing protein [Steroidobacterales bacterium]